MEIVAGQQYHIHWIERAVSLEDPPQVCLRSGTGEGYGVFDIVMMPLHLLKPAKPPEPVILHTLPPGQGHIQVIRGLNGNSLRGLVKEYLPFDKVNQKINGRWYGDALRYRIAMNGLYEVKVSREPGDLRYEMILRVKDKNHIRKWDRYSVKDPKDVLRIARLLGQGRKIAEIVGVDPETNTWGFRSSCPD